MQRTPFPDTHTRWNRQGDIFVPAPFTFDMFFPGWPRCCNRGDWYLPGSCGHVNVWLLPHPISLPQRFRYRQFHPGDEVYRPPKGLPQGGFGPSCFLLLPRMVHTLQHEIQAGHRTRTHRFPTARQGTSLLNQRLEDQFDSPGAWVCNI